MRILLLEPFMGESHKAWAEGLRRHSRHQVEILGLPGRHWKWRMHGAAESFARMYREQNLRPDLILATDMLDLAGFLALTRDLTATIPTALYFHENQLAYPWSPDDPDPKLQRDHHYGYINYRSALVADAVAWNSKYNRDSFLQHLESLLKAFPDFQERGNVAAIQAKSTVLHLGMELPERGALPNAKSMDPPLLIWNHRWEHDKNPELFFHTLIDLADEGIVFELAVMGMAYQKIPAIFKLAQQKLQRQLIHFGFVEDLGSYHRMLERGAILPVTSRQDFFGASVVEAMHFDVIPLLPNALAYPEHIPQAFSDQLLYETANEFKDRLRQLILHRPSDQIQPSAWVQRYKWQTLIQTYDDFLEGLVSSKLGR